MTLRPHDPSSCGKSAFRMTRPSAPGHDCANMTMSSYFSSAPSPGRPTTRSTYFARLDVPESNSCSCALSMAGRSPERLALPRSGLALPRVGLALRAVGLGGAVSSEPAMVAVPVQRAPDAFAQADARGETDFRPRARDVERAALREKIDAPPV